MPTRNVVITRQQSELIDRLVKEGRYQNASEVLRDGLRLIKSRDAAEREKLRVLREAAQVGIDDMEAGRYSTFRTSEELRGHLKSLANEARRRRQAKKSRK
jgi:antitoxin ParD1/3/4